MKKKIIHVGQGKKFIVQDNSKVVFIYYLEKKEVNEKTVAVWRINLKTEQNTLL